MSYCCDRARSVTWGIFGGLPSIPHGAILNPNTEKERYLGTIFSNVKIQKGDVFTRPSAGGGGLGDPLERDPKAVLEDVIDGYVTIERAEKDYGVVIKEIDKDIDLYEIDEIKTYETREFIRKNRKSWLEEDPQKVLDLYNKGEIDKLDLIRRYGVIIDYATNQLLPKSTSQFREMLKKRAVKYWS